MAPASLAARSGSCSAACHTDAVSAEVRYARTKDGAHLAYQVLGSGSLDVLSVGYGTVISIDARDDEPHVRGFEHRLASFCRFIRFDPRGLGLSDPTDADRPLTVDGWIIS